MKTQPQPHPHPTHDDDYVLRLTDIVRQTAYELYRYLGPGHFEKVYERGLAHRLRKLGIHVDTQFGLSVFDEDDTPLGDYCCDLFVERCLLVELKACTTLSSDHLAYILGYLRAGRERHGMIINFGPQFQVKKLVV